MFPWCFGQLKWLKLAPFGDVPNFFEAVYADENVWLTQKMMGLLYDVETHTINYHLKKVFGDSELDEAAVIRNFRITAADGKSYNTKHYNLATTFAIGYKANGEARREFECSVFNIDVVKQANTSLIETIEERLSITDEGRRKCAEVEIQLEALESELRRTLPVPIQK